MKKVVFFIISVLATSCQLFDKKINLSEALAIIQAEVQATNDIAPVDRGGAFTEESCEFNGSSLIYNYTLKSLRMPFFKNTLSLYAADIKAELQEQAKLPSAKRFFDACKKANVSIVYQFTETESNEMCQIIVYPAKGYKTETNTGFIDNRFGERQTVTTASEDYDRTGNDDEYIPEIMWMHSTFVGTMTGNGNSYPLELAISYPGLGERNCPIRGGYKYERYNKIIPLEGDWIELARGYIVNLCLYSDELLEMFDLEFDGEDLISTKKMTGTWSKYDNNNDYSNGINPIKEYSVTLTLKN